MAFDVDEIYKIYEVFPRRLRYYMSMNELSQAALARELGVGPATVSDWVNGKKSPRMDKVDAMCDLFHCTRSDLLEDRPAATPSELEVSETERSLVLAFRRCTPERQAIILEVAGVKKGSASTSASQSREA